MKEPQVIDLTTEYEDLYFVCLEDWSDEMKEAGSRKQEWYDKMKNNGLRVKLALDENDVVGGMIQYVPIEHSIVNGENLYFISCIWVHGYKQGRGNFRKKGMGKALLKAAEEDVKRMGMNGIVAWGLSIPVFMRASWFRRNGYKKTDKMNMQVLLWKPFTESATPPKWIRKKKKPAKIPGQVTVTSYIKGWCPAQNLVYERAKRASAELGEKVVFNEVDTFDRSVCMDCGMDDALFIDNKQVWTGPPPSFKKIKHKIEKQLRKLK
jgi:GNAT superfamily N-acetyltransferase